MKRFYTFAVVLTTLLCSLTNYAWGETLTVADGTDVHSQIPVFGTYIDVVGTHTQILYPSSYLTSLTGSNITALMFYCSSTKDFDFGANVCVVKMAEVDDDTIPSDAFLTPEFTTIYTGHLGISSARMSFAFDDEFSYSGKNLVVDITVGTAGTFDPTYFYGSASVTKTSRCQCNALADTHDFLPKTTFTYEASSATCHTPILSHTDLTEESATFSWRTNGDETSWQYLCLPAATMLTDAHWDDATLTNETSVTVNNLHNKTIYKFYIRAYCSDSEQSLVVHNTFETLCGVEELPFVENFNSLVAGIPDCWDNSEGTTSNPSYRFNHYETGADEDGGCVRFNSWLNANGNTNFLKTPEIYISDPATLLFQNMNPCGSDLTVYYAIDGGEPTAFSELTSLATKTEWYTQSADLPTACVGHEVTIIFKGTSNYGYSSSFIYIDNVSVKAVAHMFTNEAGDGSWNNTANWDEGTLPTIDDDVIIRQPITIDIADAQAKSIILDQRRKHTGQLVIEANKGLVVAETIKVKTAEGLTTTTAEDLVLESSAAGNATLIFDNDENQATVQQYSKASIGEHWNWQYIGSPLADGNALSDYYGSYLYKWDGGWQVVPNGADMEPFAGYCITQANAVTHTMDGTLVPTTSTSFTLGKDEDLVIANSWTAPIYIGGFTEETFTSEPATIYLFNTGHAENGATEGTEAGTYETIPVNSAPYTGNELIAPMQGFFVTSYGGSPGTITLNYDDLVRPADSRSIVAGAMHAPRHERAPKVLKITANGSRYNDRLVLLVRDDFSYGFDNGWDGEKLTFGDASPSLYTISETGMYEAVSAIPEIEGVVVGFHSGEDAIYTLSFDYDSYETLYLNDLLEQQSTLINGQNTYTFFTAGDKDATRFVISTTPISHVATAVDDSQKSIVESRKMIINNRFYVIHGGQMYNAEGVMTR